MKVVIYMDMTINGMIARENGDTPWSKEIWESYYAIAKGFNAIILGRKTYELMRDAGEFEKIGNPFIVIVSKESINQKKNLNSKQEKISKKGCVTVSSPSAGLALLKSKGFVKVFAGGGAMLNASLMKEGLVDDLIVEIEPLIFGRGIPLFSGEQFESKLDLVGVKKISKRIVQLWYNIRKS